MPDIAEITKQYAGAISAVKILVIVVICAAVIGVFLYWLLVVRRRKKWYLNIWEQKSDGRLHLAAKDTLIERKVDRGRRTFYWLSRYKAEATPPPIDATDRFDGKDYADYLKIRTSFTPITKVISGDFSFDTESAEKKRVISWIDRALDGLRKNPKYKTKPLAAPLEVYSRYVFVPIHKVPHIEVGYQQMDYDVDMMRINGIDNIDKMFSDKMNFWQKWGMLIMLLAGIVFVIVLAYLAFQFAGDVVRQNIAASDKVATAIEKLAGRVGIEMSAG